MADGVVSSAVHPNGHSPEFVFRQYRGRRAGIVKALTEDVEEFYEQCDPDEKALCLFGLPDGTWEVSQLPEEIPVQLPEPVCGINFARDVTPKKVWLSMIAIHSDAWLMSIAFYHAGRVSFDRVGREQLFRLINRLPTVYEAVTGSYERQAQTPNGSRKNKSSSQPPNQFTSNCKPVTPALPMPKEDYYADFNSWKVMEDRPMLKEEDGGKEGGGSEDQAITKCAGCQEIYSANDGHLWIGCDHCQRWFHGKCVGVTAEMANGIEDYMCPGCSYKATTKASDSI
ncbi:PHD finger protein ALFIN-LIKE 4-like [Triticum dicoccoides]|uniref:PHD finger protein ALFIN-LIKE 4-like n=1 Tax=Triticum dicoccoides TaxID=85692 RepID=UPI00162BEF24|nr:PHD finger protein ALFIN-LIKE 4-like [Triticum dicoccoides]XP_044324614.1 PHD finger protein ALFIN-LIKE 4-like [Triticum aestivum]